MKKVFMILMIQKIWMTRILLKLRELIAFSGKSWKNQGKNLGRRNYMGQIMGFEITFKIYQILWFWFETLGKYFTVNSLCDTYNKKIIKKKEILNLLGNILLLFFLIKNIFVMFLKSGAERYRSLVLPEHTK